MGTERNIIGGLVAILLSDMIEFFVPLKWFGFLAFVLILADLRFGVRAAKRRGEKVRFSRAIRRTGNKMVDYTAWILLAGAFGKAFHSFYASEYLPHLALIVVFGTELNSCFSNFFEASGKQLKINIFKLFSKDKNIIEIQEKENLKS